VDELTSRYPRLYHIAADGSWPGIASKGLLSTSALLDLFGVPEPRRTEIEACRRPEGVVLEHPDHGRAVVRDNGPLLESRLRSCLLDGLTPADWYRLLNRRVFFWPTQRRVDTLIGAASYRESAQLVITVFTDRLVAAHSDDITLSPINSGATRPFARPRGLETFRSIEEFDFEFRRKYGRNAVAEVAVEYAVPNMVGVVESVVRHIPEGGLEVLWPASG
jgi:hypothetical protein